MSLNISMIAAICHAANHQLCLGLGDESQEPWLTAPTWQRSSAIDGVNFHRENPDSTAKEQHENWMNDRFVDGWAYGEKKDVRNKIHPCLVAYSDLPPEQQMKDHVFKAIVEALLPFIDNAAESRDG